MLSKYAFQICFTATSTVQTSIRRLSTRYPQNSGCCFELSDEQTKIQKYARNFAKKEIIPVAADYDKTGEFPEPVFKNAWSCGLINGLIPARWGGKGRSLSDECVIAEELSFACGGIANALVAPYFGQVPVIRGGTKEQQKKYLGRLIEEPLISAYCFPEPGAESEVSAIIADATKKGDEWILNGQKMWVTGGGVANWFLVLARTYPDPKIPVDNACACFIVERDWPGVIIGRKELNMGLRAADNRRITFEDVRIPKHNIVIGEEAGFESVLKSFDTPRVLVGVLATGVAQRCLHEATKYAIEHGIENNGKVATTLADMAIDVEVARLACLKAAWETDSGKPHIYSASIAKYFAGDIANKCATRALQICGSDGFSGNSEHPVEKLFRDAKIYQLYEGASHAQRLIIAREATARVGFLN